MQGAQKYESEAIALLQKEGNWQQHVFKAVVYALLAIAAAIEAK